MPITNFTAFYPSRPFWACNKPDLSQRDQFHERMEEEVFSRETDSYTIKISRDGRVMLRVESLEHDAASESLGAIADIVKKWGEYLDFLNALYLLIDSAMLKLCRFGYFNLHEVTTRDAFRVRYQNGKSIGENIVSESIASVFQMARFLSSYPANIPIEFDSRISMRPVVPIEVFQHAANQFDLLMSAPGSEKDLAGFAKSLSEYKVGNYETSLIIAWFITEGGIASLWRQHLNGLNYDIGDGQKRINSARLQSLTNPDWTISMISNLLELWGVLPYSLYKDISEVRTFRNKIVHKSVYEPNATDTQLALKTAQVMIERLWNISVIPSLSYSVNGI